MDVERVFALDYGAKVLDQGAENFRGVPGDVGLAPAGDPRIRIDADEAGRRGSNAVLPGFGNRYQNWLDVSDLDRTAPDGMQRWVPAAVSDATR